MPELLCTLSSNITYAGFLGSATRVCVAGPIPMSTGNAESRIDILDLAASTSQMVANCAVPGDVTAVEVCGFTQSAKILIGCASRSVNDVTTFVLYAVNEGVSTEDIYLEKIELPVISDIIESSNITSMAFSSSQGLLATASEEGIVNLYDLNAADQALVSFKADAAGVSQIKFDRKGQLIAGGNSGNQLKVWDVRTGGQVACRHLAGRRDGGFGNGSIMFTSVLPHPVNDTIYAGTGDGSVVCWDIRTSADCLHQENLHTGNDFGFIPVFPYFFSIPNMFPSNSIQFNSIQFNSIQFNSIQINSYIMPVSLIGEVTSLVMHPSRRGNVLSGGNNGYVMSTDFSMETPEHVLQQTGGFRFGAEEILSEPVGK